MLSREGWGWGCISKWGKTNRERKVEETARDCMQCRADPERKSDLKQNLLCMSLSFCISSSLVWTLNSPTKASVERLRYSGLSGGYPHSTLAPQDFTHPNGEMNNPTDYMSNTFYGSSLSDAQVACSLNTHTHTHTADTHTKMPIRTKLSHNYCQQYWHPASKLSIKRLCHLSIRLMVKSFRWHPGLPR